MEIEGLFGVLRGYESATLTLWNFYIVVVLGLLGYAIGRERTLKWFTRIVLVIGFSVFALGNSRFLERNQALIHSLSQEISTRAIQQELSTELSEALSDWSRMQPKSILNIHLAVDALVILLLLVGPDIAAKLRSSGSIRQRE